MNTEPISPAPEAVTVAALDALVVKYFDTLQIDKVRAEAALSVVNKEIQLIELKLVEHLNALGRKEYRHARGLVKTSVKWSVGNPVSDQDKGQLFAWLREKGIYDKYAVVNNASLNTLWRAEREAAIKEDPSAVLTFNLPGLPPPRSFEGISKRKGNGEEE